MTQTFNYKEKFSWGFIFLALAGIAGIAYSFVQPFNIRFKSFTVLEYPNSKYAVIVIALLFIIYAVHKFLKMKAGSGPDNVIVLSDNQLAFQHLQGYALTSKAISFFEVSELWNNTDDDDGESMIIYTEESKNRYEFFAENFDSTGEFAEFKKWLELKCTNIANRA